MIGTNSIKVGVPRHAQSPDRGTDRGIHGIPASPCPTVDTAPREVVVKRQWLACAGIKVIELAAADGRALPAAEAGAHVDVHLPDGLVRQYSITNPGMTPASYVIGVLRESASRGGSSYLVDRLQTGDHLAITGPRNNFMLDETADSFQLIAGGIGVTPMLAMARKLVEHGRPVAFHYLVRTRARAAFLAELETLLPSGAFHLHVDEEAGLPDLTALVDKATPGRHIYACGPEPLLAAISRATVAWPGGQVRFERFRNLPLRTIAGAPADAPRTCRVELRRSGIDFDLQPQETLLEALEREGLSPACLCREGICGTCAVGVLEGAVDHRDAVQSDDEKADNRVMYVCVSRPVGAHLVLDL